MRNENGFSLIEVMVAMLLAGLLMALGYSSFRSYWLNRGFEGAHTTMVTELRHLQERTVSESHPVVFGAMFQPGSSHTATSGQWTLIQYNPEDPVAKCKPILPTTDFGGGAYVSAASFEPPPDTIASTCSGSGVGYGTAGKQFVFFYARGTASAGELTLKNDQLGKTVTIKVLGLTSRVEE